MEAKKYRRDYGLVLGQMLTSSCTSRKEKEYPAVHEDGERTALLGHKANSRSKGKNATAKKPSWGQVFSPQSNFILIAYGMMSMHTMAFDSLIPVFLHYPEQQFHNNPDVKLPFKFIGGFGVGTLYHPLTSRFKQELTRYPDSQTIGMYYVSIGVIGMFIQFLLFPAAAKRYGVLSCARSVSLIFPVLYLVTPFTALVPGGPFRNFTVFLLLLLKLAGSIFGFPCLTILLTNSAASLSVLGTLNGVGTSVAAFGRAAGPAVMGAAFSFGVERGYVIIPWWFLALFGSVSAIPVFWTAEADGFGKDDGCEVEEGDDEDEQVRGGSYGAASTQR